MALEFIKKIFTFGKKEVEEAPVDSAPEDWDAAAAPAPKPAEATVESTAETAPEAASAEAPAIEAEPQPSHAELRIERGEIAEEPIVEPESEPEIKIGEQAEEPAVTDHHRPEPVAEEAPAIEEAIAEPEPAPGSLTHEPEKAPVAEVEITIDAPPAVEPPVVVRPEAEAEPQAPDSVEPAPAPQPAPPKPKKVAVGKSVEAREEKAPSPAEPEKKATWFERLRHGLSRSSQQLGDSIGGIFTKRKLDEGTLQDLEDVLIQADLGLETATRITDALASGRYGKDIATDEVRAIMSSEIEKVLAPVAKPLELDLSHKPHVILVVGVNGTGKTTTIGKLAAKLTAGGLKVMLAAGDTFRAAAIEQLHIWGERTGAPVVSSKLGADAAGLAYDAWEKAKEAGSDVLIIDTAGRLQNKSELMDELAKIVRVLGKNDPEAPHTVLQTLDATTGQNALNQVEIFRNIAGVNGLVMTKLDGTARGGILVAISAKHKLPVYFIGVGEQVDDLEPFTAKDFARAIAGVA
ncbi:signal recognition particle-docking protein FtsY [Phyllobacterium salinisoli]|uniref:Signal recognition particle receptor FtsY n=1 Tax=Phyllobacterium salinisoli TaxID=1899321 RepID=A0A368K315_9HYPH|nr:signal recognition particle-docking protein FtsY [Phyllobacterium salinisoli]RCS22380.1 signal recognition particle-docking protein FtsY [Phyllobacterium salinisoli]